MSAPPQLKHSSSLVFQLALYRIFCSESSSYKSVAGLLLLIKLLDTLSKVRAIISLKIDSEPTSRCWQDKDTHTHSILSISEPNPSDLVSAGRDANERACSSQMLITDSAMLRVFLLWAKTCDRHLIPPMTR